ncbi:sn-glycerol-3-phosphate ABC transporter ATP-binding protein UgpC [Sulfidibacter corallicola]|uniref:sn-glycerol-3-phosphate ABC transporter ATP-binding protein UgpC n=1 Tax=Sulfidibacter corallicola TaxID=2818388 RepID=A0A8A4TLS5_SULCO|nr:sn-glycerol-3-phosphate ABC transporter ATP-binding protein UgpC [Sulfidibacter corallicola]QTD50052.1 sn-glycerol-3-phosphate ABC transporter ATP-binding protein UgpC [Sulfidibacter corallicola]
MSSLTVKNLKKSFGSTQVLKGIDLSIEAGQFLTLVGPSGCGKSTLLNIIAGLETPSTGEVWIGDRNVNRLGPKDRDIAMVFQNYALYPNMNVRKNISFGLEMRKVPKGEQDRIIDRVARMLQIEPLLDRKPAQLSGGQRQRVAMGRALARDPKLFLFDEPLSNLDAKLRVNMRAEIKELHQRLGTTIVYVTHDQIEAMTLGDRIAVLHNGEVQQFGSPSDIYENPANRFVAGFIGSPSMNFIPCEVTGSPVSGYGLTMVSEGREFVLKTGADLQSRIGKTVILGIRPEQITHVMASHLEEPFTCAATCPVHLCEPTGPDTLVTTSLNQTKVLARVRPDAAGLLGQDMELMFDLSKAVFFDPDTGSRLGLPLDRAA